MLNVMSSLFDGSAMCVISTVLRGGQLVVDV